MQKREKVLFSLFSLYSNANEWVWAFILVELFIAYGAVGNISDSSVVHKTCGSWIMYQGEKRTLYYLY